MTAEPKPTEPLQNSSPTTPGLPPVHKAHAVQDRDKNAGIVSRGIASFLDLLDHQFGEE